MRTANQAAGIFILLSSSIGLVGQSPQADRLTDSSFRGAPVLEDPNTTFGSCPDVSDIFGGIGPGYICQVFPSGYSFIKFPIVVDRVVGPGVVGVDVDSQGSLIGLNDLINNGVVAPTQRVRIRMSSPAVAAMGGGAYTFDVYLNGQQIGTFDVRGGQPFGHAASFDVQTSSVRFGALGPGGSPTGGVNWIMIAGRFGDIPINDPNLFVSELGGGMYTIIDVKALYPVVLVHGWNAGDTWFTAGAHGLTNRFSRQATPDLHLR